MKQSTRRLTLADLKKAASRHGATVEGGVIGRHASYHVDAPDGKVWEDSGCHAMHLAWYADGPGGAPTWPDEKQDAVADAIERMAYGTGECNDLDCDICRPDEEKE